MIWNVYKTAYNIGVNGGFISKKCGDDFLEMILHHCLEVKK